MFRDIDTITWSQMTEIIEGPVFEPEQQIKVPVQALPKLETIGKEESQ